MQSLHFILIVLFHIMYLQCINDTKDSLRFKRTSLSSTFDPHDAFETAVNSTWSTFWNNTNQGFSQSDPSCLESQTFQYSVVWDVAVAGLAIVESRDISKTNDVATSLYKYQNSQGWFAATRGTL